MDKQIITFSDIEVENTNLTNTKGQSQYMM